MSTGVDTVYALALAVTLWATAMGLGARHGIQAIRAGLADRGLFGRLLVLDVLVVPLVVLALVTVLSVPDNYAVGLLIVGTAAAGPLGFKTAQMARGNGPLAIALVIVLELVNIVAMPLWAIIVVPDAAMLPPAEIWRTLVLGILLPLTIGLSLHRWVPGVASLVGRWGAPISSVSLALVVIVVLSRDGAEVVESAAAGVLPVAVVTILLAIALGWAVGGPDPATRRTAALVSSVRANAVALAVATSAFGATSPATSAIVVFGLCSLVITPVIAVILGWRSGPDRYEGAAASTASSSAPTS
jgi:BASS family bile acid:Na+ symporter